MKYGTASPTAQSGFTGDYKAKNSSYGDITLSADVRFWLSDHWSGDDFGGDASSIATLWLGKDINGNIRTDDDVDTVSIKSGSGWTDIPVS